MLETRQTLHGSYGAQFTQTEALCPECGRWSIILAEKGFCPWSGCKFEEKR